MINQNLIIYKFTSLYHILEELDLDLNFKIIHIDSENLLNSEIKKLENYLIISSKKNLNNPNQFFLDNEPMNILKLVEKINIEFLKLHFTDQSQIKINNSENENLFAYDIAPGNCLIDEWIRKKSNKKFDFNGDIASSGKINDLILNQTIDNFNIKDLNNSLDIKNFDISFARGLGLEDGCATITKYTAYLISEGLKKIDEINKLNTVNLYLCGGGRKNNTLIENINEYLNNKKINLKNIDEYEFDGDFIESQAFAYLAIRSYLGLPISYPNTTRTLKPISGGIIEKNY